MAGSDRSRRVGLLALVGPGLLVAATGVGAGDLATAGFSGAALGLAVGWAVLLGAVLKFIVTEGVARYQIATGETLVHATATRLGPVAPAIFLIYLFPWTIFVGGALMSACGATADALLPNLPGNDKFILAVAQSLIAMALVFAGGFKLFERVMAIAIALMTVTVVTGAVLLKPDLGELIRGLAIPRIPDTDGALGWTVALIGGVGGTLTILCYGYWLREHNRDHATTNEERSAAMTTARIDLASGYTLTAVFGVAMIIIAAGVGQTEGRGAGLIINLADQLAEPLGRFGRTAFLIGAWAAIFSSMLGVWQSVPYLFADFLRSVTRSSDTKPLTKTRAYIAYLVAIATLPTATLIFDFSTIQKYYGILGATVVPMLALVLIILGVRTKTHGRRLAGAWTLAALIAILVFFAWLAYRRATG